MWKRYLIVLATFVVASAIAYGYYQHTIVLRNEREVRMVVADFGDRLQMVPLLAPANLVDKAMDFYYAEYVRPDLLNTWKSDPASAPGRTTSSPSPNRIEVTKVTHNDDNTYTVDGNIIETSYATGTTTTESSIPVRFTEAMGPDGWQISAYQQL